jgi:hypothetical protein
MRDRFTRAYRARLKAGRVIKVGRGVWISLYDEESDEKVDLIGAGAGLVHRKIASIPLELSEADVRPIPQQPASGAMPHLTIAEAKRMLAESLGVDQSSIKITVEA